MSASVLNMFYTTAAFVIWIHSAVVLAAIDCRTVGLQCNTDCSHVIYCAAVNGSAVLYKNCDGTGKLCGWEKGELTCSAAQCSHSHGTVYCSEGGGLQFPDPYNSAVSHFCNSDGQPPLSECTCPAGQCYSTLEQCIPETLDKCGRPVPDCTQSGVGRAYSHDPGFYYFCDSEHVARVGKCPGNQAFLDASQICIPTTRTLPTSDYDNSDRSLGTCVPYKP